MRPRVGFDGVVRRRALSRNRPIGIISCVVLGVLTALVCLDTSTGKAADPAADSHAAHHPDAGPPGASSPGMSGMQEMMKGMMSPAAPAASSPPPPGTPGQPAPADGAMPMPEATAAPPAMGAAGMTGVGPSGMGGGGMGGGGCCGGTGPKPFYASLMTMPSLTPEARHFIEVESIPRSCENPKIRIG